MSNHRASSQIFQNFLYISPSIFQIFIRPIRFNQSFFHNTLPNIDLLPTLNHPYPRPWHQNPFIFDRKIIIHHNESPYPLFAYPNIIHPILTNPLILQQRPYISRVLSKARESTQNVHIKALRLTLLYVIRVNMFAKRERILTEYLLDRLPVLEHLVFILRFSL
jgi:hypothetical protein